MDLDPQIWPDPKSVANPRCNSGIRAHVKIHTFFFIYCAIESIAFCVVTSESETLY